MKTLVCIRRLPYSEPTIQFGSLIAGLEGSPITLLTVVERVEDVAAAEAELERARSRLADSEVHIKVRLGDPLGEILEEAHEQDFDIVVVGSRDIAGLLDPLLGKVSDRVADRAESSVLVVKEGHTVLERVLIPTGGQRMNPEVVRAGARLAAAAGAAVTILFVTNPVPTMYTGLEAIEETLPELLQTDTPVARHLRWSARFLSDLGVKAELKIKQGVASDEIMREARQGDYDLVVIGARSLKGPIRRLLIDQVTPHVVERAPCSVLVVR